ncbi:MAG: DUF3307 domain-containing protein [Myxococcota bacterium]
MPSDPLILTFALFVAFQLKHFLADFVLQNAYMLGKTADDLSFVGPLATHCAVHASLTLAIALHIDPAMWWLAPLDFGVHFTMDRIKASPRYLGRFDDPGTKPYWWAFGFDQMVHHLTHVSLIWLLVT